MTFDDAEAAFRRRFPAGGLSRCDFRPHFDGDLVNAWCALTPGYDEAATREAAVDLLAAVADWLRDHAAAFGPGDRLQLIVGFAAGTVFGPRQIFKCGLPASMLAGLCGAEYAAAHADAGERHRWAIGVAWGGDKKGARTVAD